MRKTLTASEGHVLTNGEVYGTIIYLAEGMDGSDFYEITEEEYEELTASSEPRADDATEADYRDALRELGVKV